MKNVDVEISALVGAYVNKFSANLSGIANIRNSNGTTTLNKTVNYQPSVRPNLILGGSLSGLKAKIGDVDGGVYVATVSAEYMFTRHFDAGLAFMHTDADVDVTNNDFVGSIDWQNDNLLLYATVKF